MKRKICSKIYQKTFKEFIVREKHQSIFSEMTKANFSDEIYNETSLNVQKENLLNHFTKLYKAQFTKLIEKLFTKPVQDKLIHILFCDCCFFSLSANGMLFVISELQNSSSLVFLTQVIDYCEFNIVNYLIILLSI